MIAPPKHCDNKDGKRKVGASGQFKNAALCIAVAVIAVIAAVIVVRRDNERRLDAGERPASRKMAKSRDVKQANAKIAVRRQEAQISAEPEFEVKRYGRSSNVPTSNTNNIHYASQTGLKVVDADGNVREVRPKPIFKSRADNMLWAAVRPGGMPSGLNALRSRMRFQTGSDEAFLAALRNQDITIEPEDPPHVVHAKKMTMEIKQDIIAELDKGRTFDDIYAEISAETKKERMYERIAQADMRKIAKARDAAAMRKYVEDMNPVMRELGLKELRLPSWAEIDEVDIETTDN